MAAARRTRRSAGLDPQGAAAGAVDRARSRCRKGEALYARGRLRDALAALEAVPGGDPLRARADELTALIQRQLLDAARANESRPAGAGLTPPMKCPKCQYISFDSGDRCRNCGYEFSLSVDRRRARSADPDRRRSDRAALPTSRWPTSATRRQARRRCRRAVAARRVRDASPSRDLPLFRDRHPDDDRASGEPAGVAARPGGGPQVGAGPPGRAAGLRRAEPGLDLEPGAPRRRRAAAARPAADGGVRRAPTAVGGESEPCRPRRAGRPGSLAAVIDLLLLGGIDAVVLYLTLRICGLELAEAGSCPGGSVRRVPRAAQRRLPGRLHGGRRPEIGKMAAGIRVVHVGRSRLERSGAARPGGRCAPLGYLVSALPAGLGFLPALFGSRASRPARPARPHPRREGVTRLAVFIATVGYCGYFPFAPGTVGSAAGLLFYALGLVERSRRSSRSA